MLIDAIPDARGVYCNLLIALILSIFLLSPIRMGMEYYQRKQIYQQYIRSGTNSHLTIGSLDFNNDDNNDSNNDDNNESKVNDDNNNNDVEIELPINKDMTSSMIKENNFNLINKEEYL